MARFNADNELAKRAYFDWLRNACGRHESTVDQVAAAIHDFEAFNRFKPFKTFRREQAMSYKQYLADHRNHATGKPLRKATIYARCKALRAFFEWLAREPGYRRSLVFSDASYFNVIGNDARTATARREQKSPSLGQVLHVLETMPADTAIQRRDRAVVAFILLTGARDSAAASMRLKHVDLKAATVFQDAREVATKRAKTFTSSFFPVGDHPRRIVEEWIGELRSEHQFGHDDPLFPASTVSLDDEGRFHVGGLSRQHWTSASPIRAIFRRAFAGAGLEYFPPHRLRRTLVHLSYDLDLTARQMKAWAQSLGHDSVLTSFTSYGVLPLEEQASVMAELAEGPRNDDDPADREIQAMATRLLKLSRLRKA